MNIRFLLIREERRGCRLSPFLQRRKFYTSLSGTCGMIDSEDGNRSTDKNRNQTGIHHVGQKKDNRDKGIFSALPPSLQCSHVCSALSLFLPQGLFLFSLVINLAADLIPPIGQTFFGATNKRNRFCMLRCKSSAAWCSPAF